MADHAVSKDIPVVIANDDDRRKLCYVIGFWLQDDHRLADFRTSDIACRADGVTRFFDIGKGKSGGNFRKLVELARADLPYWIGEYESRRTVERYVAFNGFPPGPEKVSARSLDAKAERRTLDCRIARTDLDLLRGPELECYVLTKLAALFQAAVASIPDAAPCTICQTPTTGRYEGRPLCEDCRARVEDYAARFEARRARLERAASKAYSEGTSSYKTAREMASRIPFGQPILVGHHSEGSDRRYRDRIHDTFGRAFAAMARAERLNARAATVGAGHAISSDDPLAVEKLEARIAELETWHEKGKQVNSIIRKKTATEAAKIAAIQSLGFSEARAREFFVPDCFGNLGVASFTLTNNNANIRRLRDRLTALKKQREKALTAPTPVKETRSGGVVVERDAIENRIRLKFPGKPNETVRSFLKSHGFRWAPSEGAWQRHLNGAGEFAVNQVLTFLDTAQH